METPYSPSHHSRTFVIVFLSTLIVFIIALSLFVFSRQSLRLDEAQSLWQTSHTPFKILDIVGEDVHVPLYHLLLHFWQFFFGNGVETARLLSLIFFIIIVPSIYLLGSYAYGKTIGLLSSLLITISPFMNWYGNEIRMYSLFTLLVILNQYFFIKIFRENKESAWWGYVITSFLGIYTHYYFFLNLLSQFIFFISYKKRFPQETTFPFVKTAIFLTISFIPWLLHVFSLGGASNTRPILLAPTSVNLFNAFSQFFFGFQTDHINTIFLSFWPLAVLLGFLTLRRNKRITPEIIYLITSIFIPISFTFIISILYTPLFVTRYLIFTLPSLYIFLGWIFSTYPRWLNRLVTITFTSIMLITLTVEVVSTQTPAKENYREAAEYLEEHTTPSDTIVVSAPFTIYPIEYYYHGPVSIQTLPIWDRYQIGAIPAFAENNLPNEVNQIKNGYSTLWLLLSYDQGYEEKIRLYFDQNYERIDTKNFSKDLNLYAYKLKY